MLYATQAILHAKGLRAKSHAGAISLFGKEVVEKGIVPKDLGRSLHKAFDLRQKSDYDVEAEFEWEDVDALVNQAKLFVETIGQTLSSRNGGK